MTALKDGHLTQLSCSSNKIFSFLTLCGAKIALLFLLGEHEMGQNTAHFPATHNSWNPELGTVYRRTTHPSNSEGEI